MAQQQTHFPGVEGQPVRRRRPEPANVRSAKYPAAMPSSLKAEVMSFVETHRRRGGPSFNDLLVEGLRLAYERARAQLEGQAA